MERIKANEPAAGAAPAMAGYWFGMPTSHETPRLAQLALPPDLPLVKLAVGRHVVATAPWVSKGFSLPENSRSAQGAAPRPAFHGARASQFEELAKGLTGWTGAARLPEAFPRDSDQLVDNEKHVALRARRS